MPPDPPELPVAALAQEATLCVPGLPHAPPFRLLDRVLHIDVAQGTLWAQKRITANDALWPAEAGSLFLSAATPPSLSTLPSLLLIEALSQAAACFNLLFDRASTDRGQAGSPLAPPASATSMHPQSHLGFLVSVSDFGFPNDEKAGATVGETLLLYVKKQESLGPLVAFFGQAFCAIDPQDPLDPPGPQDPLNPPNLRSRAPAGSQVAVVENRRQSTHASLRPVGWGRLLFAVTSK